MGRPRKPEGEAKEARLSIKVTRRWLAWVKSLAAATGKDKDVTAMIERLAAQEARRVKHDPPPGESPPPPRRE